MPKISRHLAGHGTNEAKLKRVTKGLPKIPFPRKSLFYIIYIYVYTFIYMHTYVCVCVLSKQ